MFSPPLLFFSPAHSALVVGVYRASPIFKDPLNPAVEHSTVRNRDDGTKEINHGSVYPRGTFFSQCKAGISQFGSSIILGGSSIRLVCVSTNYSLVGTEASGRKRERKKVSNPIFVMDGSLSRLV